MWRACDRRTAQRLAGRGRARASRPTAFALAFTRDPSDAAQAGRRPRSGRRSCAARLIQDWRDGRIDGTYPIACYRKAARSLPTDLQVYSSAPDDIRQALASASHQASRRAAG